MLGVTYKGVAFPLLFTMLNKQGNSKIMFYLPNPCLVWFHQKGFPTGKIGMLLSTMYEIRLNGLEYLLQPLK